MAPGSTVHATIAMTELPRWIERNIQGLERGKIRIPRACGLSGLVPQLIPISSHHLSSSVDDDRALHHPNRALQILASRRLEEFLFGAAFSCQSWNMPLH